MFDFAWSEIALIAVVAMIAIGPKDMPGAIRAVTGWVKKARRMAAEFQTHVDEMVREADLSEVRSSINEIRDFDFRGTIEKTIDADGSIRSAFAADPLAAGAEYGDLGGGDRGQRTSGGGNRATGRTGGGRDAVQAARAGLRATQSGACGGAGGYGRGGAAGVHSTGCRAAASRASVSLIRRAWPTSNTTIRSTTSRCR